MNTLTELKNIGIIPVVCINDANNAEPLARALIDGGINAAEITFRTDAACESIRRISKAYPEMLVGAGTILTVEQAKAAVDAGSRFIVSPGLNPKVVTWCLDNDITVLPGCTTPTEIEQAIELGLDTVKFFPAEQSGGLAKIKAMSAPYTNMKFMPTGGISLENMNDYLAFKSIIACGGSFMVSGSMIDNKDWAQISALSAAAVKKMLDFKTACVAVASQSDESAKNAAAMLCSLLGADKIDTSEVISVGNEFKILKKPCRGQYGYIAISTQNVERAMYYLGKKGLKFDTDTIEYDCGGNVISVYLVDDMCGFAIRIIRK